jgi:hypothetical protein
MVLLRMAKIVVKLFRRCNTFGPIDLSGSAAAHIFSIDGLDFSAGCLIRQVR